ncbi:SCO2523 family variant P-loop protein [Actinoplanes sp. HUAS TT8]|uniref:SCO2523 family variant P-loop protein n=1 Tax=Actinoplanes sp. HUAS TT8 TaxID=3447453 RepID=UPI003F522059
MFVFAASDKGGTGRSVTSCNLMYRAALDGHDVCYLDFDFGSPTAGAVFGLERAESGTIGGAGLHSYLNGTVAQPERIDVWEETGFSTIRDRPVGAGRLVLFPGDVGGADFRGDSAELAERCEKLFRRLNDEFSICFVDLSAGRNLAVELALRVTAMPSMRNVPARWLVFHRWTRQHVIAAGNLVNGPRGLLPVAKEFGHDPSAFAGRLRFVRTVVINPDSLGQRGLSVEQTVWLQQCDWRLLRLADSHQLGRNVLLGSIPTDPVLQWQEQLITDSDVVLGVANVETRDAFIRLARDLVDDDAWETL